MSRLRGRVVFGATLAALCALAAWTRWPGMNPESPAR